MVLAINDDFVITEKGQGSATTHKLYIEQALNRYLKKAYQRSRAEEAHCRKSLKTRIKDVADMFLFSLAGFLGLAMVVWASCSLILEYPLKPLRVLYGTMKRYRKYKKRIHQ